MAASGDLADLDGSYGVADGGRRFLIMRFGAAEVGMNSRWCGHERHPNLKLPNTERATSTRAILTTIPCTMIHQVFGKACFRTCSNLSTFVT
jgi:hypothetical protein